MLWFQERVFSVRKCLLVLLLDFLPDSQSEFLLTSFWRNSDVNENICRKSVVSDDGGSAQRSLFGGWGGAVGYYSD